MGFHHVVGDIRAHGLPATPLQQVHAFRPWPLQLTAQHPVVELGRVVRDIDSSVRSRVGRGVTPFVEGHQLAYLP